MDYKNCKVGKYHRFLVIAGPYSAIQNDKQIEVCEYCKEKKAYAFTPDGKMADDHQYFLDHIRAFAQPSMGDVYYEVNPGMLLKFEKEAKAEKAKEAKEEERKEHFKFAIKRALDDKADGIKG